MEEIASKWDTYSSVQQSGIATSLAGVRQRENIITLFENWDLVKKYEDISANAYGTAVEKMEAYSQGVEAARKRVQAAWEGFALIVNESGVLETAFNGLAVAIENIHWIILAAITSLVASNPAGAAATLSQAFTKLNLTLGSTGLEQKLGLVGDSQATIEAAKQARIDMADAAFVRQKQILWGDYLGKFKGGMNDERFSGFSEYQSELIGLDKTDESEHFIAGLAGFANALQKGKDGTELATKSLDFLRKNIDEGKAQILLNTVSKETANTLVLSQKKHIEEGLTEEQLKDQTTILAEARKRAAMQLLDDMGADKSQYYSESDKKVFTTATGNAQKSRSQSRQKLAVSAMGSLFGSIAGGYGGSKGLGAIFASSMGEDARSAGESIGSIIGMVAGQKAVTTLIANWGLKLTGSAALTGLVAPWLAVIALVAGAGYGIYQHFKKKAIQEAQEDFKELKDTYESQLSASTKANQYDELAKRVDQFGRNVSLSEEEYKEFLSVSNELAEVFPDLVVRTDAAGNSFLGTAGKVGKLTEAIDEMVKKSQDAADQALLKEDVFGTAFDDIKDESKKGEKEIANLQKAIDLRKNILSTLTDEEKAQGYTEDRYGKKHYISAYEREIDELEAQIENVQNFDLSELVDYNNAIMRQDEDLQTILNSLSEESAIMAKQTMANVFSNLDMSEYKNKDEYRAEIENLSNKIAEVYKNNPRLVDLEANRTGNAGEYFGNRKKLLDDLVDSFGGYADLDESEKKILIGIGFEFDEDSQTWVDAKDTIRTIGREFGFRKTNKKNGITAENLGHLSTEDVDKVYGYLKSGEISKYTSMDTIVNMLYADREVPENIPIMTKYVETLSKQAEEAKSVLSDMSFDDWKAMDKDQLQKTFSSLPEAWRNGIKGIKDAIDNGDFGEDELKDKLDSLYQTFGSGVIDASSELAKLSLNKVFSASQLTDDIDGIVDSMSELQKALKAVAESYDALKEAQKEQNAHRKLSLSTVVDLLATNMNYAQVLEFETDAETGKTTAIRLAANAQQIMNQMQIDAIKANLEVAIANNNLAIQEKQKQISLLKGETVTNNANKQTEDAITLTQVWGKVTTRIAKALARVVTLLGALKSGSSIKSALEQAENASNAISEWDDVEWVTKYQSMSRDERETAIQNLRDEIVDLQSENKTYRYTADNLNANNIGSELRGYVKNNDENAKKELEDWLSALEGVYNKEFYLRKSLIEKGNLTAEGQDMYMSGAYYDKMRDVYTLQSKYYEAQLPKGKAITEYTKDQLAYYQKWQEVQVKLKNLDDERVEDKINILQLQDVSYDQLIAAQEELIKTSDTLEEQITRENELNNLIKQRYELYRDIASWQREMLDIALEYESGTPDTAGYADLVSQKKQNLENEMEAVKQRMAEIQDSDRKDKQEELRNLAKQYAELYKEYATVDIDVLNDKLDVLERRLDLLEKSKPQEWAKYDDIAPYYQQNIGYLEQKAALIREQLEDVSMLTDEQVQNLVDQLNDVTVALHEAQMQMLEDQKNYKESQYNALVSKVQEYITELEDAMDEIEKAYEDELKPLEQANEERERAIKLEELLAAKKRAAQEKERVYRQGIGWVYESPRSKQREAQKDLDDFKRQDKIDDLTGTKDAEKEALQERIDNLNLYLKALEWSWNEAERIERDRLLAEMMNIDQSLSNEEIQKEMRQRIMDDMQNFIEVQNNDYQNYLGIFSSFINSYTQLVLQLAELQRQALSLINSSQYLGSNAGGSFSITNATGGGGFGNALDRFDSGVDYSRDFQAEINAALKDPRNYGPDGQLSAEGKAHLAKLEKYRNEKIDLGLGGNYEKTYNYTSGSSSGGGSGKSSGGSGNKTSSSGPYNSKTDYNNESKYLDNLIKNGSAGQKAWAQNQKKELDKAQKGYADGIENGPVTYTGLSMLHGTHSKPEYVLNSDQAYNILRNLATTKLPEYTSTLSQDMGVSYVIQGDVVLENCDDPAQFWNQVMAATHNRYNVTKNKR